MLTRMRGRGKARSTGCQPNKPGPAAAPEIEASALSRLFIESDFLESTCFG
jgi:hypothetical protein